MRRLLPLALVLFFSLAPLASALASADDSNLPACCRRNGAHHCEMSPALEAWLLRATSRTPAFSAPSHCPNFPAHAAATSNTVVAFTSAATRAAASTPASLLAALHHVPLTRPIAPVSGRGPPALPLA